MNENTTHKHSFGCHPSSFRLPIFVGNRATHTNKCVYSLSPSIVCVCVRSHPAHNINSQRTKTTIAHRLYNSCISVQWWCQCCQPNIPANNPNSFLCWSLYCQGIKASVYVPILGSGHRNSHTVLLSYCANCVQRWMILNFGWTTCWWTILLLFVYNIVTTFCTHETIWYSSFSIYCIGLELVILISGSFVLNQVEVFRFHSGYKKQKYGDHDTLIKFRFWHFINTQSARESAIWTPVGNSTCRKFNLDFY